MMLVNFNGRSYTPETLATMDIQELVNLHNRVASLLEGTEVDNFSNEEVAQTLTWGMLSRLESQELVPERPRKAKIEFEEGSLEQASRGMIPYPSPAPLQRKAPSKRLKRFKFPMGEKLSPPRPGTLRHRVMELLSSGATYAQVIECVRTFDADRNVDEKNAERRAYEVIRLLHFYNGYGMSHDGDIIRLVEKR